MGKPRNSKVSKPQDTSMHRKRTKTARKKLSARKRMNRRQNQSLQKVINKIHQNLGEQIPEQNNSCIMLDNSCIMLDNSKSDYDELDGETVMFIEDRTGDEELLSTTMEDVSNCSPSQLSGHRQKEDNKKRQHLANKPTTRIKMLKNPRLHSTPISRKRNQNLNISNISAVKKSPQRSLSREISNLSEDINTSYVTIDLTKGMDQSKSVIDLTKRTKKRNSLGNSIIDLEEGECSETTASEADVTVIHVKDRSKRSKESQIAEGIANLNASEKDRLLTMITENIFNGCKVSKKKQSATQSLSAEDSYIKNMIEGNIRNSIGGNVYNPNGNKSRSGLRMIVIDGSNVAMQHGQGRFFSVKGLKICIDYFLKRGHTVKAFVPQYRCASGKCSDPQQLDYLKSRGFVIYTPSRILPDGRSITSYDDRFIVQCATEFDGVIVSGDNYRDIAGESPRWADTIQRRLLQFTWVQDMIMFPVDPLGKNGPRLDEFLRHS